MTILIIILSMVFYFIPTMVAVNHKQFTAIFMLNLLLGWSILGWIGALVWACTKTEK